jgi:ATP-dependent DNA helicase RecG
MEIFPLVEDRQLEFKELLTNHKRLCETVVAFSNDVGGRIIIGVRDSGRAVIGFDEETLESTIEDLPKIIYDTVSPYCRPIISTLNIGGKNLIEIRVFPGDRKPYFIKNKGVPEGVYFRIGSHNRKATPELIEDLMRTAQGKCFDLELVKESKAEDFDQSLIDEVYKSKEINEQKLLADNAIGLDTISMSLVPTVSGHIYFNKEPNRILPQAEVLLTLFAGVDNSQILKTLDISAPLPLMADYVLTFLLEWVGSKYVLRGARKVPDEFDIPKEALREAIVNALIHRKYFIPDAIKIAVYSDRVEIYSPGNFPGLMGDLTSGMSYPRNPHLRQLARKHNLVEKRGLGLNLIFDLSRKNGNPTPKILEVDDAVKVIFYRARTIGPKVLPEDAEALETEFLNKGEISISDATNVLGVSPNTARKILKGLEEQGFIKIKGKGRATRYYRG